MTSQGKEWIVETLPAAVTPPSPTMQQSIEWSISGRWMRSHVMAMAVGAAVGIAVEMVLQPRVLPAGQSYRTVGDTAFEIGLALGVLLIGAAQGLALRQALPAWCRASLVAALIALALALAGGDSLRRYDLSAGDGMLGTATGMFGEYVGPLVVFGLVLGLAQWLALRPFVPRAWLWIPVNAFALTIGMPIGHSLGLAVGFPLAMLTYGFLAVFGASDGGGLLGGQALVLVGLLMYGVVVSIVTKLSLRRLLRSMPHAFGAPESVLVESPTWPGWTGGRLTSTQIDRVAGGSLIMGAVLAPFWGVAHVVPAVLLGAGIWVVHRRQVSAERRLSLVGTLIVSVALALGAASQLVLLALGFYSISAELLTRSLLCAGMFAFGIASIRAHVFPRLAGSLVAAGAPLYHFGGNWAAVLSLGFIVQSRAMVLQEPDGILGVWGLVAGLLGFVLGFAAFGICLLSGRYGRGGEPGEIPPS